MWLDTCTAQIYDLTLRQTHCILARREFRNYVCPYGNGGSASCATRLAAHKVSCVGFLLLGISDEASRRWHIARNEWWTRNWHPEVKQTWSRGKWSRTTFPFIRGRYIEKRIFANEKKYDFGRLQFGLFLSIDIYHDSTIRYGVYVRTEDLVSTRLPAGRPKYLASIPRTENKVSSRPQFPDQIVFGIKNDTVIE
jgi:hypothetical protein